MLENDDKFGRSLQIHSSVVHCLNYFSA